MQHKAVEILYDYPIEFERNRIIMQKTEYIGSPTLCIRVRSLREKLKNSENILFYFLDSTTADSQNLYQKLNCLGEF